MNPEAIQRVAQNLPSHMMQTLSAVANQTPHYPHTPGGTYGANYLNTVSFPKFNIETCFFNDYSLALYSKWTNALHDAVRNTAHRSDTTIWSTDAEFSFSY